MLDALTTDEGSIVLWTVVATLLDVRQARRTPTLEEFRKAITDARPEPANESVPVAPAAYHPGNLIADRYEVVEKLGSGGFSVVYRTIDRAVR